MNFLWPNVTNDSHMQPSIEYYVTNYHEMVVAKFRID